MIRMDDGKDLMGLLRIAARCDYRSTLFITVPFHTPNSKLWQQLLATAAGKVKMCLYTRPAETSEQEQDLQQAAALGIRAILLPGLHAKAALLISPGNHGGIGWVGSCNFTRFSETHSFELGIFFRGNGDQERELATRLFEQFIAWTGFAKRCRSRSVVHNRGYQRACLPARYVNHKRP